MKITHICLSCFYIDGFAYQENELVAQNILDGHDVTVIASTETYGQLRKLDYIDPGTYLGSDGATVIRIPYRKLLPKYIMRKLRMHPGVLSLLEKISPDVILFHGICSWELLTIARYKSRHPHVKVYVDSHTDFNNSARNFISKYLLHYLYYKPIIQIGAKYFEKILCVSQDVLNYACNFYKLPPGKLEFFPLGGKIIDDSDYEKIRRETRIRYELAEDHRFFFQSGKIDSKKKLIESLQAFLKIESKKFGFLIVGSLQDDIKQAAETLIGNDPRVKFLGWKSPGELRNILCASDIYVQPGSQSATMQMSLCCRCAVILADVLSHNPYIDGNGWLVSDSNGLEKAFLEASSISKENLLEMSRRSSEISSRLLDYRMLAARLYR